MKLPGFYAALILMLVVVLTLAACKKEQAARIDDKAPAAEVTADNVSYNNFVGKLLQSKCSSCHAAGQQASSNWAFSGFNSVKNNGERISQAVLIARTMPMGGSLTSEERTLLESWFKRNMPEN
jgi:uncharacterized membrane protein